jgi:glycosyltransferase involved in cell wall biosynthesis
MFRRFADTMLENLYGANLFDIFNTIGSAGSLYTLLAPYFVAYGVFTKDRRFCGEYLDSMGGRKRAKEKGPLKIAHFTDTFHEVNGVAWNLQMQLNVAQKNNKRLTVITCGPGKDRPGVVNFTPIGAFAMPEYPVLKLYYPPVLRMLDFCYEQNFTHIHSATPGPIGLTALIIARILKLPLYGTYHTALPQYTKELTQDDYMGDAMWKYVVWYYNQMDVVYVPSKATGEELAEKGVHRDKVRFYPRGVDTDLFHPSKRNGFLKSRFGVPDEKLKILYVGRISKEKNLALLVEVFRKLAGIRECVHLITVGDGPYLEEMKQSLDGLPVTFTGFLSGENLAGVYAASDVFVFPSTTDTFGNVVIEAQASGLPVIVTDEGGPKENLLPGKTGFIIPADDTDAFLYALTRLIDNTELRKSMGASARDYIEKRSFESAYLELWESYRGKGQDPMGTAFRHAA